MVLVPLAAWRLRRKGWPPLRQLAAAGLIGVVLLVGSQAVALWGVHYIPAGVASVFGSSSPLFLALFAWALLSKPLTRRQLAGVGIGFMGLALMGWSSATSGEFKLIGALAVVAASATWAGGSLLANRLTLPNDPVLGLTAQLLTAGALLCLISLATGDIERLDPGQVPMRAWGALAFLTVASTLVGYAGFLWLNRTVSSAVANTFCYVAPVIAMALAALFLAEPLSWIKAASSGLALLGVGLMVTSLQPRAERSELCQNATC
jgi:drug/metabolite transporter (DMT)-like permease